MTELDRRPDPADADVARVPTDTGAQTLPAQALEQGTDAGVTDHGGPQLAAPVVAVGDRTADAGGDATARLTGEDLAAGSMSAKVARGASWTATSKLSSQAVQFVAGLALARLLTPADYGTMANVYVVSGFAILFFELGLGSTVIALRNPTQRDLSTVFWVNALGGVLFTGVLALAGPLVAEFFDDPRMTVLTPLAGLAFLFGLGSVHNSLLQRQLRFKTLAVIAVSTSALGLATTIVLALLGLGVYALVLGPVVTSAASSVMSWALVPWRPTGFISRSSLPALWSFSGGQLGFNVVNYWGRNADNALIGRFVGDIVHGYYNKAYSLMLLPVQQVGSVLGRVMFPALAAMKGDKPRVARGYRRSLRLINIITFPLLVGMAATAPALVPLLWGDQWHDTVPLLMILCFAGIPQCLATSVGWIYQSQNRTGRMFRMGLVTSTLGVVLMALGVWVDGARGVAVAVLVRAWLFTFPTVHFAGALIDLKARTVVRDALPVTAVVAVMFGAVWSVPTVTGLERTGLPALLVQVAVGGVVFLAGARLLAWRNVLELRDVVLRRRTTG